MPRQTGLGTQANPFIIKNAPKIKGLAQSQDLAKYLNFRSGLRSQAEKELQDKMGDDVFNSDIDARVSNIISKYPDIFKNLDPVVYNNALDLLRNQEIQAYNNAVKTREMQVVADDKRRTQFQKDMEAMQKYDERREAANQKLIDKEAGITKQAEQYASDDYADYKEKASQDPAKPMLTKREYINQNFQKYKDDLLERHGLGELASDWVPEFGQRGIPQVKAGTGLSSYLKEPSRKDMTIKELIDDLDNTPYNYKPSDFPKEVSNAIDAYKLGNTAIGMDRLRTVAPGLYDKRFEGQTFSGLRNPNQVTPVAEAKALADAEAHYDENGNIRPEYVAAEKMRNPGMLARGLSAVTDFVAPYSEQDRAALIGGRVQRQDQNAALVPTISEVGRSLTDTTSYDPAMEATWANNIQTPRIVQDIGTAFRGLGGGIRDMASNVIDYWRN